MAEVKTIEEIFSAETLAARLFAQASWKAELANKNKLILYHLEYDSYVKMFYAYGGDPAIMAKVKTPVVPMASAARIGEDGYPEVYETDQPLMDPPLELPKRKEYPENQVVFGRDLTEDGYTGWYASSMQLADRSTVSTTVAVGTIAQGPDGADYVLTKVGFGGLAKYWVRKV
jgi:hypothetical protein